MSIVDARGREVRRATIEHNAAGLRELLELLSRAGAREVAIERPDGPVVDTLLEAGITVVVISPNQLKNLRGRYGSAGNKDDRFDAFVLADTLRTDRSRLRPLLPDTPATATLRRTCRPRKDLVAHRVALANQLHTCGCESNATTQVTRSAPTRPEPPSNSGNRAASPPSRGWKRFALRWAIGGTLIPARSEPPCCRFATGKITSSG